MSDPITSDVVPHKIRGYWIEDEEFLYDYVLIEEWTAFEAACLLKTIKPEGIKDGVARIGLIPDAMDHYNVDPKEWVDAEALINLTKIIFRNNNNRERIPAKEIVAWAVENGLLNASSYLARRLATPRADVSCDEQLGAENLQKQLESALKRIDALTADLEQAKKSAKNTGKIHAENREKILAAALSQLALYCDDSDAIKGGKIVAAELARRLEKTRVQYGLSDSEEHGFGHGNILKTLRAVPRAIDDEVGS